MIKEMTDYLKYSENKDNLFYSRSSDKLETNNRFELPHFDDTKWYTPIDEHWAYMIFKDRDFPDQGWKIHITTDIREASYLLYDVAIFLIKNEVSFKYVPSLKSLKSKNSKYANRGASGKFITVYPENNNAFIELLNDLKEITSSFNLGPYILNDQQWQESNVFFRYGGLKRIVAEINGEEVLAIRKPDGTLIPDERMPYYKLPDFVMEPEVIKANNTFPDKKEFDRLKDFKIIEAIHNSNAGGVYLAELEGKKVVLKEGRDMAGVDANFNNGFQRNKHEYNTLKRLKDVKGVINVDEYFTSWRHNYFIEEFHTGKSLQKFIAQNFPFTDSYDKTTKYAYESILIINQLMDIIEEIHNSGVAMGDLSLSNILLSDNNTKVTLIDFEAAAPPENKFSPGIATPGFISSEANNYMEADWFAFYRIARTLFLPITPICDIAPQIIGIHDQKIEKKFGKDILSYLKGLENKISKYTNLYPMSPFLNKKLCAPVHELSLDNTDYIIKGIRKGIINNINSDTLSLIKGNIEQYDDSINRHNIAYGSFGVILSLIRSDSDSKTSIKVQLHDWFEIVIPYIKEISKNPNIDMGLFTGISGIITVLYELGYEKIAFSVIENVLKNLDEEKININNDISVSSGLSGIGLFLLSFHKITGNKKFLDFVNCIYSRIVSIYENNRETLKDFSDFGLLTGWSGAALFLWKFSLATNLDNAKKIAIKIIDKSFESVSDNEEYSDELYVVDDSRGFDRLIPYIENGSSGIALTMIEFHKEDENYLTESRKETLDKFIYSNHIFCSANGGLFNGYVGLMPLASAVYNLNNSKDMSSYLLDNLNNYLIREEKDEILFPGKYGFKCSMDVSTGAAGVLLVLSDIKKEKWGSWMPIPGSEIKLFEL